MKSEVEIKSNDKFYLSQFFMKIGANQIGDCL